MNSTNIPHTTCSVYGSKVCFQSLVLGINWNTNAVTHYRQKLKRYSTPNNVADHFCSFQSQKHEMRQQKCPGMSLVEFSLPCNHATMQPCWSYLCSQNGYPNLQQAVYGHWIPVRQREVLLTSQTAWHGGNHLNLLQSLSLQMLLLHVAELFGFETFTGHKQMNRAVVVSYSTSSALEGFLETDLWPSFVVP